VRIAATCSVAGLVLASCAASTVTTTPHVTGLPAVSISVPLSNVACTTDNSCVALGTSDFDVSPTSVGEYRSANGRWAVLAVPVADTSTYVLSSSCWSDGCLFVGSQSNRDLVWRYDGTTHTISVEASPAGGLGIDAVSCYASMSCSILDASKRGVRLVTTDDGAATWSTPQSAGVPAADTVSSLACSSPRRCIASLVNASNGILILTLSGDGVWTPQPTTSTVTWAALTSLNCVGRKCLGLAKLDTGSKIVRTDNFGRSWTKVTSLHGSTLSLACTDLDRCVVGGMTNFQSSLPSLATVVSGVVTAVKLKYVPSPIGDVACGTTICAAVGVTTVMSLRP
jgi:hypothetical protein